METPIYVAVAAVNLGATVFDTNDLSTVRGSSLALLDAGQRQTLPREVVDDCQNAEPPTVSEGV